jgi:hypothetical protein
MHSSVTINNMYLGIAFLHMILLFPIYTLAEFELGSFVPQADEITNSPHHLFVQPLYVPNPNMKLAFLYRCYYFKNIFSQKFGTNGVFYSN